MTRPTADDLAADVERIRPRTVIAGLDGNVVIPPALAAEAAEVLLVGMREMARRDARTFSPKLLELVAGCEWAARIDKNVNARMDKPSASVMIEEVTQAQAARIAGVTRSPIGGRIERKSLRYRADENGRKWIRITNLVKETQ